MGDGPTAPRQGSASLRGSVRVRTTAGAMAVVGLALGLGAAAMLFTLRGTYVTRVESTARQRADDLAGIVERGVDPADMALDEGEDRVTQIVASDGRILASSRNAAGAEPLDDRSGTGVRLPIGDADDTWVVVERDVPGGAVVIVGRELDSSLESASVAAALLAIGVPLMTILVGLTTWRVVGRSLAPVESIRAEAASIDAADLDRRVPVPSGDDEIARLAETVNAMLERLEKSQARRRRFLSDVSHELRSPLSTIRHQAEVAATHPERTSTKALGRGVLSETDRLSAIVDDLILLARADESSLPVAHEPIDLDDIVLAEAARLTAIIDVDRRSVSAGRVAGDRHQLQRVVSNLADNAARHARERVTFGLAEDRGQVLLTVDDDGPGIPVAQRTSVFDRFIRLDESRTRDAGGSGLGLAIVGEIVDAHGGTVAVTDAPTGGARIEVRLPATVD